MTADTFRREQLAILGHRFQAGRYCVDCGGHDVDLHHAMARCPARPAALEMAKRQAWQVLRSQAHATPTSRAYTGADAWVA